MDLDDHSINLKIYIRFFGIEKTEIIKKHKKLFFIFLRPLKSLDKKNLRNSLEDLEVFVDDPPAPELPATVIVDAGWRGNDD